MSERQRETSFINANMIFPRVSPSTSQKGNTHRCLHMSIPGTTCLLLQLFAIASTPPAFTPDYYDRHTQYPGDEVSSSDNSSTGTPADRRAALSSPTAAVVVGLWSSLMALLTIIGNSFTLVVFGLSKSLRKFGDFFIINLAIADLAIGVMSIPPHIPHLLTGTWQGGHAFCLVWLIWDFVATSASSLCICVISIDRYLLVVHPLLYRRIQSTSLQVIMLAIPWGVVLLLYVPSILLWELSFGPKIRPGTCHVPFTNDFPFLLFTFIVEFALPYTLVAITSVMIIQSIRTRMRKVSNHFAPFTTTTSLVAVRDQDRSEQQAFQGAMVTTKTTIQLFHWSEALSNISKDASTRSNVIDRRLQVDGHTKPSVDKYCDAAETTIKLNSGKPQRVPRLSTRSSVDLTSFRHRARKDIKVAWSLFVLVMVFAVCWIPYEIVDLVSSGCHYCVNKDLYEFTIWLLWFNSTINPVLYPILHRRFREAAACVIAGYVGVVGLRPVENERFSQKVILESKIFPEWAK